MRTLRIPVYDRFTPVLSVVPPAAYAFDGAQDELVSLLRLHGVVVERLAADAEVDAQLFAIDSLVIAPRAFQGHREVRLEGRWRRARRVLPAGSYVVPIDQPLSALVVYLLEPQSDDGLAAWNVLDRSLREGGDFPVTRVVAPVPAARRVEP